MIETRPIRSRLAPRALAREVSYGSSHPQATPRHDQSCPPEADQTHRAPPSTIADRGSSLTDLYIVCVPRAGLSQQLTEIQAQYASR